MPIAVPPESTFKLPLLATINPETVAPDITSRSAAAPASKVTPSTTVDAPVKATVPLEIARPETKPPLLTVEPLALPKELIYRAPPLLTTNPEIVAPDTTRSTMAPLSRVTPSMTFEVAPLKATLLADARYRFSIVPPLLTIVPLTLALGSSRNNSPPLLTTDLLPVAPDWTSNSPPLLATKPETVAPVSTVRSTIAPFSRVTPSITFEVAPPL